MIDFGPEICGEFAEASSREWLETNGIGGYSSGTISGVHTRRYHGMLIAAVRPPLGRVVTLSKLEETLIVDGRRFELSSNQFPGTVHPDGYKYITSFRLHPFPIWTFNVEGCEIEKRLFMVYGENTTVARWTLKSGRNATIELLPLLAFRDHHHLRHEGDGLEISVEASEAAVVFTPNNGEPPLHLSGNFTDVERTGVWYRNFEYEIERERGFDFQEDLYQPCTLSFDLDDGAFIAVSMTAARSDIDSLEKAEIKRRAKLIALSGKKDEAARQLVLASDAFIVKRGEGRTVIAGYPWFSDWGRDTMIALPGLALATKRPDVAKSILLEFSKHISDGMIPNRFPDEGETPEYNTVDATLWFFEATRAYVAATGDVDFVREVLYEKFINIIDWHFTGTRYGIMVDEDGFITAGGPENQLTWMDAKIGDLVITPRTGKPVEIQALWYNALVTLAEFAEGFGDLDHAAGYHAAAAEARLNFEPLFWNEEERCLFDVVNDDHRDAAIRPNQIFAVSLHHSIIDGDIARAVVKKVEAELLTPVGLRSLSPRDPAYIGEYGGTPFKRDSSYHQGTVWGWLIGPFIEAYRKVHAGEADVEKNVMAMLSTVVSQMSTAGLGQVSEIYDGDAPHAPRGCPAQAWSVAELLRVLR
jgi:predicted glycogen debranching enzyme